MMCLAFQKKKGKKSASKEGEKGVKGGLPSNSKNSLSSSLNTQASSSRWSVETPTVNSDLWWKAYHNLLERFENDCMQLSIPCFVSSVDGSSNAENTPACR